MLRLPYHPNAFLSIKRNIKPGLSTRSQIILILEIRACTTRMVSRDTGLHYSTVLYHLHLLEAENILSHKGKRSYIWELTGKGQQKLIDRS